MQLFCQAFHQLSLGLYLPSVDVDAFVPHYLKRVEAEENWLKTHEETNRDNYIKRV